MCIFEQYCKTAPKENEGCKVDPDFSIPPCFSGHLLSKNPKKWNIAASAKRIVGATFISLLAIMVFIGSIDSFGGFTSAVVGWVCIAAISACFVKCVDWVWPGPEC